MVDLHIHTTASDGTLTPAEIVTLAKNMALEAIAVTDHDTAAGAAAAATAGADVGLEVIPGIEISADFRGQEVHILGYFIDPIAPALAPVLDWVVQDRNIRNKRIAEKLEQDGYAVSFDALQAENTGAVIGRPHFARALVALGHAASVSDAFQRFLGEGRPYYLPRTFLPLSDAVAAIRNAGGVSVLAHPLWWEFPDDFLRDLIATVRDAGVIGLEARYSTYTPEQSDYALALAKEFSLLPTGGSDFHGAAKPEIRLGVGQGDLAVPRTWLTALKEAHRARMDA